MGVAVLVGTRKGLFVLTSDETRRDWKVEGPHLTGSGGATPLEDASEIRLVTAVAGG